MRIEDFLRANVEEYLFQDLRTMLSAAPAQWNAGGGVGYPLVMTTFAGIELLGELLLDGEFPKRGSQESAFTRYWVNYLYPGEKEGPEVARILYKLARHGIAHVFVLKGPLKVAFDAQGYHLTLDTDGCVTINAKTLATDLMNSYRERVAPTLRFTADGKLRAQMQARLDGMEQEYARQTLNVGDLKVFRPAPGAPLRRGPAAAPEAQGPTGPTFSRPVDSKTVSASFLTPIWKQGD